MQAEPEAVDNTSWTGDETTIVSNQQSMLAVWDMAAWSRTIIAIIAPIASYAYCAIVFLTGADEQESRRYEAGRVNGIAAEAADMSLLVCSAGRVGRLGGQGRQA